MARLALFVVVCLTVQAFADDKYSYTEDEVLAEIGKVLGDDNIAQNIREYLYIPLSDLGFDELAQKEIIIDLEEAFRLFGIEFTELEESEMKTIRDLEQYIIVKLKQTNSFDE